MPIPVIVIVGHLLRIFIQWAVKQIVKKYGKKILVATFREAMRFLLKKYGPKVAEIQRGETKVPFDEWLKKASSYELRNFFRKYGVELTDEVPNNQVLQSLPKGKLNPASENPNNSHISEEIFRWYTLGGHRQNHLPKTEL